MMDDSTAIRERGQRLLTGLSLVGAIVMLALGFRTGSESRSPRIALKVAPSAPGPVLMTLPGVGPARAKAIQDEFEIKPFTSIEDLERRVRGIGPATSRELSPFLRFDAPSPTP